jgi:hypothetical protein
MDAFKKLETRKQRRESTKFVFSVSRVIASVLIIALLVGIVVLISLLSYVPDLWPTIEHLFWK